MSDKKFLVDIVNLNADASCLSNKRWISALHGKNNSELYQFLNFYVQSKSKVVLGIVGSTLSEIIAINPEAIDLINKNPATFEIIHRPYIHSLSILWSDKTFTQNYLIGKKYIDTIFDKTLNWYLPPEFALRNSQILRLQNENCSGTFIHPKRIKNDLKHTLPKGLFHLKSIQNSSINCIAFSENFDSYYLDILQKFSSDIVFEEDIIIGWRDGESPFFLPESVRRESIFIEKSNQIFERKFLSDLIKKYPLDMPSYKSYPQNSLLPWLGNFRLYWLINEIKILEETFSKMESIQKCLFLNLLNSDILSSIEKSNIDVLLKDKPSDIPYTYTIKRKERNMDAEELLYLIKHYDFEYVIKHISDLNNNFGKRIKIRLDILEKYFKEILNQ